MAAPAAAFLVAAAPRATPAAALGAGVAAAAKVHRALVVHPQALDRLHWRSRMALVRLVWVDEARSTEEALRALHIRRYSLLVLAARMAEVDARAVLQAFRHWSPAGMAVLVGSDAAAGVGSGTGRRPWSGPATAHGGMEACAVACAGGQERGLRPGWVAGLASWWAQRWAWVWARGGRVDGCGVGLACGEGGAWAISSRPAGAPRAGQTLHVDAPPSPRAMEEVLQVWERSVQSQ